jgi:cytochrome P450
LLHRHKLYWENPDAFIPERFLPDQPRPDKCLYLPFSVGPRVCLGLRFGLTESILCLAILAQKYSPKIKAGHKVDISCRLTLRPGDALPMRLEA